MRRRLPVLAATSAALSLALAAAPLASSPDPEDLPRPSDCTSDEVVHSATVTPPELSAPGFPQRRITTVEINEYVDVVAAQSERVVAGTLAQSWMGTDLVYALVTSPENHERMDEIVAANQRLREPRLVPAAEAASIAAETPAIVWYEGNVHGNETSGADAAVSLLHDLADRTDCTIESMLDSLVIGIVPTQNPDGRDTAARQNAYAFDMNRDWFAATQPETRGKMALLADYPPVLFIDAHEMGNSSFFFPPNADPIHHEVSDAALAWIDELYAPEIRAEFDERRATMPSEWDWFNYDTYDLFYMGYGDSLPTTLFGAAGMTFEKGAADADGQKHDEQYVAGFASLRVAAEHRERILGDLWASYDQAWRDGQRGHLEPNLVVEPGNEVTHEVPDEQVFGYVLTTARGETEARHLVARLRGHGVEVSRFTRPATVTGSQLGRDEVADHDVPAGSWWVTAAQPHKRWVHALLAEDPFVPFDYFYDVSSWSNPQLMNVHAIAASAPVDGALAPVMAAPGLEVVGGTDGELGEVSVAWLPGSSGQDVAVAVAAARAGALVERLTAPARLPSPGGPVDLPAGAFVLRAPEGSDPVGGLADVVADLRRDLAHLHVPVRPLSQAPAEGTTPFEAPRVAVFQPVTSAVSLVSEPWGHLLWQVREQWGLEVDTLTAAQVATGALVTGAYDVFLVGGSVTAELDPLALVVEDFVASGGTYVGLARGGTGGTAYAVANGWTTSTFTSPRGTAGGTTFAIEVDPSAGPVALGAAADGFWFNLPDDVLSPTTTGRTVATYPTEDELFFSGFAAGEDAWAESAVVVEEALGDGRVVLFSGDPAFRGLVDGPAALLANALVAGTVPGDGLLPDVTSDPAGVARARASMDRRTLGWGRPLVVEVDTADADAALAVLRTFTFDVDVRDTGRGTAKLVVPNPHGLDVEGHPWSGLVRRALEGAGVDVRVAFL